VAVAWIAAHLTLNPIENGFFLAALGLTSLTILALPLVTRLEFPTALLGALLCLVPPLAPLTMSHMMARACLAGARGREEGDPWRDVLRAAGMMWFRIGNVGAAMAVVLGYYILFRAEQVGLSVDLLMTDPLRLMTDVFGPFIKGLFLVVTLVYGVRFMGTLRLHRIVRRADGSREGAPY
jgi:hypothetical protein